MLYNSMYVPMYVYINTYCKHRKFRGVINFVVFADARIPRNLIFGSGYKPVQRIIRIPGEPTVYSAILVL